MYIWDNPNESKQSWSSLSMCPLWNRNFRHGRRHWPCWRLSDSKKFRYNGKFGSINQNIRRSSWLVKRHIKKFPFQCIVSWVHVGSSANRVERMIELGNHFWNNPSFCPQTTPFREWMSINFFKKEVGCHYCPIFLGVDPRDFGTNHGSCQSIGIIFSISQNISITHIWVRYRSAVAIGGENTRFPKHQSSLIHLLARLCDYDSKTVNLYLPFQGFRFYNFQRFSFKRHFF